MSKTTRIMVRVQAKGGKFLGDDIGGALVTLRDARTGQIFASDTTRGDSGSVVDAYSRDASQRAIVTPGDSPTVRWLLASASTSRFYREVELERPTLLEVSVVGPGGGLQTAHGVSVTEWVIPGQDLTSGPGLVVELPGLLVQVMDPATHTKLAELPAAVRLRANVTMMCGCPIAPGEPWIPDDFDVFADIGRVGEGAADRALLTFDEQPSRFTGFCKITEPGYYEAVVTAIQKSTGNTGVGVVTFFKPPSG